MVGSLIFVHGTGVRLDGYKRSIATINAGAKAAGIAGEVVECAWGPPLGIEFKGLSLPDSPDESVLKAEAEDLASWTWLFADPLAELDRMAIRATPGQLPPVPPGETQKWETRLEQIRNYAPSFDLALLLKRGGLEADWNIAWPAIVTSPMLPLAFERSEEAGELEDCVIALARATVAQLHIEADGDERPGPSAELRDKLTERLAVDWKANVLGFGAFLGGMVQRAVTSMLRSRRNAVNRQVAMPLGDILLYQSRGADIRAFIQAKIEAAEPPVTVVAHSLGGIACFDLLALERQPNVSALITVGSQAPFFHEIGALASLRPGERLPLGFPRWLNIYDRDDFLSFVGERLFEDKVEDFEVKSRQPFPASHSAYFGNAATWKKIAEFAAR